MNRGIKDDIIQASYQLFVEQGYSSTTMRQISDRCNIAVGNLTYHFPKKEDIIMQIHNDLLMFFLDNIPPTLYDRDPWIGYFAAEYSLAVALTFDPSIRRIYFDAINFSALRQEYYDAHQKLFMDFMEDAAELDEKKVYYSTVAMCSLQFNLLEAFDFGDGNEDIVLAFDEEMLNIFKTRLLFLGISIDEHLSKLEKSIKLGKRLHFDPVSQTVKYV